MSKFKAGDKVVRLQHPDAADESFVAGDTAVVTEDCEDALSISLRLDKDGEEHKWGTRTVELIKKKEGKPIVLVGYVVGDVEEIIGETANATVYVTKAEAKEGFAKKDKEERVLYEVTFKPIKRLKKGIIETKL